MKRRSFLEKSLALGGGIAATSMFCSTEELAKYGLKPIPVEKIGPKKNRWIKIINQ